MRFLNGTRRYQPPRVLPTQRGHAMNSLERRMLKLEASHPDANPVAIIIRRIIGPNSDEVVRAVSGDQIVDRRADEDEYAFIERSGGTRPIPVIGTREHRMTAPEHPADVRLSSQRSSPSGQADLAATPNGPCASALGDARRYPGRSEIRMTFQRLPGPNSTLALLDEGSYTLVSAVGFLILVCGISNVRSQIPKNHE
jgi:hypothetical protein